MHTLPYIESYDLAVFDDPVDHIEPIEPSVNVIADTIARLMVYQISGGDAQRIAARTLVLAQACGIDTGENIQTFADIARACGLTRSAVSLMSNELRDQLGITSRNCRSQENRENCRKAKS